jgi:hypothetical protein
MMSSKRETTMDEMNTCFICRFWRARPEQGFGFCQRYAPRPRVMMLAETTAAFSGDQGNETARQLGVLAGRD